MLKHDAFIWHSQASKTPRLRTCVHYLESQLFAFLTSLDNNGAAEHSAYVASFPSNLVSNCSSKPQIELADITVWQTILLPRTLQALACHLVLLYASLATAYQQQRGRACDMHTHNALSQSLSPTA